MDIKELVNQINLLFKRFTTQQKIVVGVALFTVIAFISFLLVYNSNQQQEDDGYRVLFENIAPKDAGLIVQELRKSEIPYKLVDDKTIEVPKEFVYDQRIQLASMGLPRNSKVGFELFDNQEFGSTDFDQKIKFLRALEGELSKTIESLEPVTDATVHIALPKESVFVSKEVLPTASIVLTMQPNMILLPKQVRGIQNLVSASVPKLKGSNVKIIDQNGAPLGEDDELSKEKDLASAQFKYKKEYERNLEKKVVDVLSPFIGSKDRVVARITVDFDFSQLSQKEEVFDPENVTRSEQVNEEKREGFKEVIGGVPGAVSNVGPIEGLEKDLKEKMSKSTTTTNYEISKTIKNTKREFAIIERITAAVVVDGRYESEEGDDGGLKIKYIALDETEMETITNLVKQAIGYQVERKDEVTVSNFEFNPESQKSKQLSTTEKIAQIINPILPYIKYIIALIVLFVFYKKVIVPFSKKMLELQLQDDDENEELIKIKKEEEEDLANKFNDMKRRVEKELGVNDEMTEDDIKNEVIFDKLKATIEERPEEASVLFTSLIKDEAEKHNGE